MWLGWSTRGGWGTKVFLRWLAQKCVLNDDGFALAARWRLWDGRLVEDEGRGALAGEVRYCCHVGVHELRHVPRRQLALAASAGVVS